MKANQTSSRFLWEAFSGQSIETTADLILQDASVQDVGLTERSEAPNAIERFMWGINRDIWVASAAPNHIYRIRLLQATVDPAARLWSKLFTSDNSALTAQTCTIVQVCAATREGRDTGKLLLRSLFRDSAPPPWDIKHPRFDASPGLRWKNKRRWESLQITT